MKKRTITFYWLFENKCSLSSASLPLNSIKSTHYAQPFICFMLLKRKNSYLEQKIKKLLFQKKKKKPQFRNICLCEEWKAFFWQFEKSWTNPKFYRGNQILLQNTEVSAISYSTYELNNSSNLYISFWTNFSKLSGFHPLNVSWSWCTAKCDVLCHHIWNKANWKFWRNVPLKDITSFGQNIVINT